MGSFFDDIPAAFHERLKNAINEVNETNELLRQVKKRFGTDDPKELAEKTGMVFDGIPVTQEAVAELEDLKIMHESRRSQCQEILDEIANAG